MPNPPNQHRLVAVDTNVLLDFAAGSEAVLDAVATLRRRLRSAELIVSPTVVLELAEIEQHDPKPEARAAARAALLSMRVAWGFRPMNLMPVGHGIVEHIGERLLDRGLIPREERHDAIILAEAALSGCSILPSTYAPWITSGRRWNSKLRMWTCRSSPRRGKSSVSSSRVGSMTTKTLRACLKSRTVPLACLFRGFQPHARQAVPRAGSPRADRLETCPTGPDGLFKQTLKRANLGYRRRFAAAALAGQLAEQWWYHRRTA